MSKHDTITNTTNNAPTYNKNKATAIGLIAIVLWSTVVGLIRGVSEGLGPIAGAAMIYTTSALLLILVVGFPRLRHFPRQYLFLGSLLFVSYEICLSLSLGYAHSSAQAIEVGMVNYLWPSLTILFAIIFTKQTSSLWIIPGLLLAFFGVCWVLAGEQGLHVNQLLIHIQTNPFSYILAFLGAIIWAAYCTVTTKMAKGANGITLFFILTALVLWINYLFNVVYNSSAPQPIMNFNLTVLGYLVFATFALGIGYATWNIGILYGHVTVLATASYFTPVLSAAFAATLLSTSLSFSFWQGAVMVSIGSLICWLATKQKKR